MSEKESVQGRLPELGLEGWWADAELHAHFLTGDFAKGLVFVNGVGDAAEELGHHPDVLLTYGSVDITLSSHDVGAITDRDVELARRIQAVASKLGVTTADGAGKGSES